MGKTFSKRFACLQRRRSAQVIRKTSDRTDRIRPKTDLQQNTVHASIGTLLPVIGARRGISGDRFSDPFSTGMAL
jgi:hypothetical protein